MDIRDFSDIWTLAIDGSGTGIWDRNVTTGEIRYSASWHAILGYTETELSNRIEASYARVHPDDLAYVQATIQAHFDRQTEIYEVEHRLRCKDGSYKWVLSRGKVISRDESGHPLRMVGTTTDITSMRVLAEQLRQNIDLITNLTNEIPGLVFQYRLMSDGRACFSYVSDRIREIYEVTPAAVADTAAPVLDRIHPDDCETYRASLAISAANLTPWHLEYRVLLPKQGLRWRQADARPSRLLDGGTLWHGLITDITERKYIETELTELARIDCLTQLPNRRYFREQMEVGLNRLRCIPGTADAVIMIDIDYFKTINDTHGHTIGDAIIQHFACILEGELRKNDAAGRMGGDEFAVELFAAGLREARVFSARLQSRIAETPVLMSGKTISFTISVGIAIMSAADTNIDGPLSRADLALYDAKQTGRNRISAAVQG